METRKQEKENKELPSNISLKKNDDCAGMSYMENNNEIPAIVYKDNFIGTQFHPEKSQTNGNKFLEFFLNWKKN